MDILDNIDIEGAFWDGFKEGILIFIKAALEPKNLPYTIGLVIIIIISMIIKNKRHK